MILRLELQTKKLGSEEIHDLIEDYLMDSYYNIIDGIIVTSKQEKEYYSITVNGELSKLIDVVKLTDYIAASCTRVMMSTEHVSEDKKIILTVRTELDIKYKEQPTNILSDIHNILAGCKEYINSSIVLSEDTDNRNEVTLSVFVDELSGVCKIRNVFKCIDYILSIINMDDLKN